MMIRAGGRSEDSARTPVGARAIFADGRLSIDCRIRNFSITGARLALDGLTVLPDQFLLEVPVRNKTYRAELRWKSRDAAGVKFLDEVAYEAPPASLDQLQDEIALLRRRNAEMAAQLAALGFSEWNTEKSDLMPPQGAAGH
jgi:hypothetical protein